MEKTISCQTFTIIANVKALAIIVRFKTKQISQNITHGVLGYLPLPFQSIGSERLKTLAAAAFLVTLFLAVEEKVTGSKGFETKTITDDGALRALILFAEYPTLFVSYGSCVKRKEHHSAREPRWRATT